MSIKVRPADYPEITDIYNNEGKHAAYEYIKEHYGIKNPTCVMNRMKQDEKTGYDPDTDRFECKSVADENIFMGLEDLCNHQMVKQDVPRNTDIKLNAMEKMVHSLISDRLLEISRYVTLDPISHRILVDQTSMRADGYTVCVC